MSQMFHKPDRTTDWPLLFARHYALLPIIGIIQVSQSIMRFQIFRLGTPFKIFYTSILSVFIYMIYNRIIIGVRDKCFSYYSMQ